MSYQEASRFAGAAGPLPAGNVAVPTDFRNISLQGLPSSSFAAPQIAKASEPETTIYHGEALARDPWAERHGTWIVLTFIGAFALFLIGMNLIGQIPGQSFVLKGTSDILQFVGEVIGFIFCVRITVRLYHVSNHLRRNLMAQNGTRRSANEMAAAHAEAQTVRRSFLAWAFLSLAIAFYASGQAVWTSYDIRMPSAEVPFPGLYDIGFVTAFPLFLIGTLLLTRRNKASVGRIRLILDALAVIGTALAISWFFLLDPLIAGLSQTPDLGAAILSIYFPTGDLFLVATGAFLMFSPMANRAQQSVFSRLCLGLFFLAITDSLLAYYNLSFSFNTGTLQDLLWPLSMCFIGLAAIEYPKSVAREQAQEERKKNTRMALPQQTVGGRLAQVGMALQTTAPFILVLATCAILLIQIAPRGGAALLQAELIALALVLIVIARQALTLLENNRLTMQMRGELVISRRELQVTRREADEAVRTVQDQQVLDEGIVALRHVHARVARGDLSARAPSVSGPLLPIAISLNLMLDRLSSLSQRGSRYDTIIQECRLLHEAIERVGQGQPPLPGNQQVNVSATEMRSAFLGLAHLHRIQENQWKRMGSTVESMASLTRRIRETLHEIRQSRIFSERAATGFEAMILDRVIREIDLLEQQEHTMSNQITNLSTRQQTNTQKQGEQAAFSNRSTPVPETLLARQSHSNGHNPYHQRVFSPHYTAIKPLGE